MPLLSSKNADIILTLPIPYCDIKKCSKLASNFKKFWKTWYLPFYGNFNKWLYCIFWKIKFSVFLDRTRSTELWYPTGFESRSLLGKLNYFASIWMRSVIIYISPIVKEFIKLGICLIGQTLCSDVSFEKFGFGIPNFLAQVRPEFCFQSWYHYFLYGKKPTGLSQHYFINDGWISSHF